MIEEEEDKPEKCKKTLEMWSEEYLDSINPIKDDGQYHSIKLKDKKNENNANKWCIDTLQTAPRLGNSWMRYIKTSHYISIDRSTIFYCFKSKRVAVQFKLMGF